MYSIISFFTMFNRYTRRMSLCAATGLIAGAVAGNMLTIWGVLTNQVLQTTDVLPVTGILWGLAFLILLFILILLVRLTLRSVFFPAALNSLITCLLTVWITHLTGNYLFSWLIGMIIGFIVGSILCYLNTLFKRLIQ